MSNYAGLHVHTDMGSLMDGVATPEEYAKRASDIGMPALACTDHGSLSAHRRFYRACKDNGVKPVLGIEAYITQDRFDKRDKADRTTPLDLIYNHIIILAKNANGLENLNRLNEIGWTEGFYRKPRIDFEVLDKYGDDLIISTACMSGLINKAIEVEEYAVAKSHIKWFKDRFEDDFYLELMPHNVAGMNTEIYELAKATGSQCIVTPDCHHCTPDQKVIQEIMLLTATHGKILKDRTYEGSLKFDDPMERLNYLYGEDRPMSFHTFDIHLLDYDEMKESMEKDGEFGEEIYSNTLEIADKIEDYKIKRNLNLLPIKVDDPQKELEKYANSWLEDNNLHTNEEYMQRMSEELDAIRQKSFAPYFLVVRNMVNWAKSQGILVGPGRGSAAGSLVCFALGITEVDPLKYGLLFSRFVDIERDDYPDIDVDIADIHRDQVKAYLEKEYKNVASIATFMQFKDKGVVRDVSRIFHVPLTDVNKVLKTVDTWEQFTSSKQSEWFREKYPEVVRYGDQLRGRVRGTGIHAAGVVTSKQPIFKYAPMETRSVTGMEERIPVVALDMEEVADIGLIKIDALGLKTLTVIDDTMQSIKDRHGIEIKLTDIDLSDKHVYQMLSDGNTKGVFQCMLPDQKIHTIDGFKKAKDITVGDQVLTHTGSFEKVLRTMSRQSENEMYEINLGWQNGSPIYLTGEHPILVADHNMVVNWQEVSKIKDGRRGAARKISGWNSYACVPKTSKNKDYTFCGVDLDPEFSRFLGLYLAEGCFSKDGKMQLTFNAKEQEYIDFAQKVMSSRLNMNVRVVIRGGAAAVIGNKKAIQEEWSKAFGTRATNKKIPHFIYSASEKNIREFILGYSQGDGRMLPNGSVGIQTASESLAWGMKALAANIGCFTMVKSHKRSAFNSLFKVFTLNININPQSMKRVLENQEYLFIPIRSVKKIDYSGEVVNFEVKKDNSYVGEIIMHNCEATPYTNLLVKMGVKNFDELVASNALVRPGAMNTIGKEYMARKHGKSTIEYVHPAMAPYLQDTYGQILYQEQVMQACTVLGGMSMAEANKVRKIIGKKKDATEFDQFKDQFIRNATQYISPFMAENLWHDFEAHAGYSFNKSHAVAYSMLSYWTAWLKFYYPVEFMFAILKNEKDKDARTEYLIEAKRMGISLKLPHINESDIDFKIEGKGIRFGLTSIKWISEKVATKIINNRPFYSYQEVREIAFKKNSGINSRAVEAMNAIGALTFVDNPRDEEKVRSNLYEYLNLPEFKVSIPSHYYAFIDDNESYDETKCHILLGMAKKIKRGQGWTRIEFLDKTGSVGIFDEPDTAIEQGKTYLILAASNRIAEAIPIDEIDNIDSPIKKFLNYKTLPYGQDEYFVLSFNPRITKAGKKMAHMTIADHNRDLHAVVVFPSTFAEGYMKCEPGSIQKLVMNELKDGTIALREVL